MAAEKSATVVDFDTWRKLRENGDFLAAVKAEVRRALVAERVAQSKKLMTRAKNWDDARRLAKREMLGRETIAALAARADECMDFVKELLEDV